MIELVREKVIEITERIIEKLKEVEKEYEIKIEKGRVGYDSNSFHFDLKCRLADAPPRMEEDYEFLRSDFLDTNSKLPDLHTIITTRAGKQFKIVGANLRARKYPILIEDIESGDIHKSDIVQVQDMYKNNIAKGISK